jgi:hypothetical protein
MCCVIQFLSTSCSSTILCVVFILFIIIIISCLECLFANEKHVSLVWVTKDHVSRSHEYSGNELAMLTQYGGDSTPTKDIFSE